MKTIFTIIISIVILCVIAKHTCPYFQDKPKFRASAPLMTQEQYHALLEKESLDQIYWNKVKEKFNLDTHNTLP